MNRQKFIGKDSKISIIIPCYNVEQYIDRCLESVVNQTIGLEHMEIILVNDASVDSSLFKLKLWEQQYPENIVLVTYDKNIRQGGARNIGLSYATGNFIGFVDSDDWIEPDMYEVLVNEMITGMYDVVRCQLIRDRDNGKEGEFVPEWGGIVTGLYARTLIFEHDVYFPENISYEDNYWGDLLNCYVKSEYRISKPLYHYYVNAHSTVMERNQKTQLDRMKIETMLLDTYKERGFWNRNNERIFDDFLERYYLNTWFIIFTRFDDIPDVLEEMRQTFSFYFPNYKERVDGKIFTYRSSLLINMLLGRDDDNVYSVKLRWLQSWLKDQGINAE